MTPSIITIDRRRSTVQVGSSKIYLRTGRFIVRDADVHVWHESDHPRGQPENSGQFAPTGGSGSGSGSGSNATSTQKEEGGQAPTQPTKWVKINGKDVVINPGPDDLALLQTRKKDLRVLPLENGNIAVGNMRDIIHSQMATGLQALGNPDVSKSLVDYTNKGLNSWLIEKVEGHVGAINYPNYHEPLYTIKGVKGWYHVVRAKSEEMEYIRPVKVDDWPPALRQAFGMKNARTSN
jgi:hypothetical protein